ncbi:DUF177 domain-containing protein [Rhodospirillaceae bacterium SYSU D60014]|uniref:YceD family protein n=1 Tax=Virgifigura deserti TaxID=2268457 RepID=UPI000E662CEE
MVMDNDQQAEFSRLVAVDRIGGSERVEEIAASESERGALVDRFGWLSMERLTATVRLRRLKGGLFRVFGRYEAALAQPCVVTLNPVPVEIAEEFDLLFGVGGEAPDESAAVTMVPTDEEPPEPIVGGQIDIGEAVVQQLAVSLDPYPRCPDAVLPGELTEVPEEDREEGRSPSPFEVLAKLKGQ